MIKTVFTLHTVKMCSFNSIADKSEFHGVHERKMLKFKFLCVLSSLLEKHKKMSSNKQNEFRLASMALAHVRSDETIVGSA